MTGAVRRGLVAGAAGTTALNAATYVDMALRGRPPSRTPDQVAQRVADALGRDIPGSRGAAEHRRTARGALGGIAVGLAVGVAASLVRATGLRLPGPVAAVATGAAAMAASDLPATVLRVSDPRDWSTSSWVSDILPHLVYGATTHAVLRTMDHEPITEAPPLPARPSLRLLCRSVVLGVAAGSRSSLGVAGPALFGGRTPGVPSRSRGMLARSVGALMLGAELVADKHPDTPSRLDMPGSPLRLLSGAGGAVALARRDAAKVSLPAVAGALGAVVGTVVGSVWREQAGELMPDWRAGLVEDVVAVGLAALACSR